MGRISSCQVNSEDLKGELKAKHYTLPMLGLSHTLLEDLKGELKVGCVGYWCEVWIEIRGGSQRRIEGIFSANGGWNAIENGRGSYKEN